LNHEASRRDLALIQTEQKEHRFSGIALMTTVITLCFGAIIGGRNEPEAGNFIFLLFVPIVLALLQQLSQYCAQILGSQSTAAMITLIAGSGAFQNPELTPAVKLKLLKTQVRQTESAFSRFGWSSFFYSASNFFCVCSVISFIAVSAVLIFRLSSAPPMVQRATRPTYLVPLPQAPSQKTP